MNFEITEDQQLMIETARRIGGEFGLDYWREKDDAKEYPKEIWQAICDAGFCGIAIDERYGGAGLGMIEVAMAVETLCAAGGGSTLSQIFMLNPIFGGISITRFGTDEMKQALLPGMVSGDITFAMGLTEPDAGTNTLEMRSFAEREGDGWRLNGQKIWITAVPQAEKMLVAARSPANNMIRMRNGRIKSKRASAKTGTQTNVHSGQKRRLKSTHHLNHGYF